MNTFMFLIQIEYDIEINLQIKNRQNASLIN